MLRFLLLPLVVVQLFMMFGADTASPGWDPNGSNSGASTDDTDVRVGWDPNG